MKKIILILLFINFSISFSEQYGWTNIGERLPNTLSTATISSIAVIGDSIWVTSGYGTYQNNVPGEIYFSSDRGKSFSIQSTKYGTHSICMLDSKRGYCVGVEGQIYRTSNGGDNWERWTSLGRTLMSIDFPPNSDTGYCTGFTGGVKLITPSGLQTINMGDYVSNIYSVSAIDKNHAFVAGEEIISPIFDCELQIDQSYPGTNGNYAIDMIDTTYGWCVGSPTAAAAFDSLGCMIIRTTDGHNWEEQVNPVKGKYGTLMAVKALSKSEAWASGTSGVVLHTTDGGNIWNQEAKGFSNEMLYGIAVAEPNEIYITGNNRTILKYGTIDKIEDNHIPEILLSPNPVRESLSLKDYKGKITIINIFGEEILTSEVTENSIISMEGCIPGIYFLHTQDKTFKFLKL